MRKAIAMVFAGGRGEDLSVLTERRPKSAVIFGGIYRCIDFALTNLARAGIGQVGILAQYRRRRSWITWAPAWPGTWWAPAVACAFFLPI